MCVPGEGGTTLAITVDAHLMDEEELLLLLMSFFFSSVVHRFPCYFG